MIAWIQGKPINWESRPDLETVFEDFQLALVHSGYFNESNEHERPENWRKYQSVLSGTWAFIQLRAQSGEFDFKKLR